MSDVILPCVIGTGIIASVEPLSQEKIPPLRTIAGVAGAGILLFGVESVAPDVANGLAILMLLGALLTKGIPAAKAVNTTLSGKE